MFRWEIKRSLCIPIIIISVFIGTIFQIAGIYYEYQPKINVIKNIENSEKTEIDIQITKEFATESLNSYNGWITGFKYYVLVLILVCVLPYSTSYIIDEHSGFLKYSILKSSRRSAIICKSIVNAIIGGITTSIPPILSLIIMIKQFTNEVPSKYMAGYANFGSFTNYLYGDIWIYILIFICIFFLIGLTYSTFAMAISMITKNLVMCILIPQIYWLAGSLLTDTLLTSKLSPWSIFYSFSERDIFIPGLIHTLIILIFSVSIIYLKSREDTI